MGCTSALLSSAGAVSVFASLAGVFSALGAICCFVILGGDRRVRWLRFIAGSQEKEWKKEWKDFFHKSTVRLEKSPLSVGKRA